MRMKIQPSKIYGIYSKTGKNSNTKANLTPKESGKKQQIHPTPSRRRELIKIQVDLNEIENRRTMEQIKKTNRSWFFKLIR